MCAKTSWQRWNRVQERHHNVIKLSHNHNEYLLLYKKKEQTSLKFGQFLAARMCYIRICTELKATVTIKWTSNHTPATPSTNRARNQIFKMFRQNVRTSPKLLKFWSGIARNYSLCYHFVQENWFLVRQLPKMVRNCPMSDCNFRLCIMNLKLLQ